MFNFVPLAGSGWSVANRNFKVQFGRKLGQLDLPQPDAGTVGPATVGGDEPLSGVGVRTGSTNAECSQRQRSQYPS